MTTHILGLTPHDFEGMAACLRSKITVPVPESSYRAGDLLVLTSWDGMHAIVRRIVEATPTPSADDHFFTELTLESIPELPPARGLAPHPSTWTGDPATCGCYDCSKARDGAWKTAQRFINCPTCGNKRCPRATHHDHACTHSNDEGQTGSRYA